MSHIQYTLRRSGRYYYNRRVPKHAVQAYGSFIRLALCKDPVEAEAAALNNTRRCRLLDISFKNHFNGLFKWPRDTHVSLLQGKNFAHDDGSLQKCGDSFS